MSNSHIPTLSLNANPHAAECTMCFIVTAAIKDSIENLWKSIPNDPVDQMDYLFKAAFRRLQAVYEVGQPINTKEQILQESELVLEGIAATVDKQGSNWSKCATIFRTEIRNNLKTRLSHCINTPKNSFLASSYVAESYVRARRLFQLFIEDPSLNCTFSLRDIRRVEEIQVRLSQKNDHIAMYDGLNSRLIVGYEHDASAVIIYTALPLYFFHEIFSHIAPYKDLAATCADGWLMFAAHKAWKRLIPRDEIVRVEYGALTWDLRRRDQHSLMKMQISPYYRAADIFAEAFPEMFWPLTLGMLTLESDHPTEQLIISKIKFLLLDTPTDGGENIAMKELEKAVHSDWSKLAEFAEVLSASTARVEKQLGLKSFLDSLEL